MFVRLSILVSASTVVLAAASGCPASCGPNSTACTRCTTGTCTFSAAPVEYELAFDSVGLCSVGFYPTSYPLCLNVTGASLNKITYTCSSDIRDIRDSRILQLVARQRGLAYAISPTLSNCMHSCADVGLAGDGDSDLNAVCGDCVPSSALVVSGQEIQAVRATPGDRSAAVWGLTAFPNVDASLLNRRADERGFEARRVYVCADKSERGVAACLRELRARGLVDDTMPCYDGSASVTCPRGGSGHNGIEWAGRIVSGIAFLCLLISLNWWLLPVMQLSVGMLTWCNEQSPLLRAMYQGCDIILLKWDFTSSCADGISYNGCQIINVCISAGILLLGVFLVALASHVISWMAGGRSGEDNNYSSGMGGRIASRNFRLTVGGAITLWFCMCMVPLAHFGSAVVFASNVDDYSTGAYWIFAILGILIMVIIITMATFTCCISIAAAARVSREVRGLASDDHSSAPVVAQTPYGEVVSAVGGYAPLYRAYVTHVHGPASLVSATSGLWNSGWWNWFPSGEPLAWSTFEGTYDGDSLLVRQCGPIFNSFNPSNIIFGGFAYGFCTAGAILSGVECLYIDENIACCIVRAALLLAFIASIFGLFMLRRPLLGDNILPALLLLVCTATWLVYLIFQIVDTAGEVTPQSAIICLLFIIFGIAILIGVLHTLVRFAHLVMADGAVPAVSTVAIDVNDRGAVATLAGMEPGASYIATTQQQGGLVSVPTFYGNGHVKADPTVEDGIPAPSKRQHPLAGTATQANGRASPVYYPHPQQVPPQHAHPHQHGHPQQGGQPGGPQPELMKDGNWLYTDGDEWPVESSYTIISQQ